MNERTKVIVIPGTVGALIILLGIILGDIAVLGNLTILAIFISFVPYFLFRYSKFIWLKNVEAQFPNFVRDLSDSVRSGISLSEAIKIATRSNYGKLTPEIVKMNNRLSWGTPFLRVLDIFSKKIKDSRPIMDAINILKQSHESGGNIVSTLDAVSRDMVMLREAEAERVSLVKQQVFIMYGIFFIFMVIAIMIILVMVPMIESQSGIASSTIGGLGGFTNPCQNTNIFPCDLFGVICATFGASQGIGCYYTSMLFVVIIIQGIFTGLITGQLGENSVIAGGKHSIIMVFTTVGLFLFLAKAGLLPF